MSEGTIILILVLGVPLGILACIAEHRLRKEADAEPDLVVKQLKHIRIDNLFLR